MELYAYLPKCCILVYQNVVFLFTKNIVLLFTGYMLKLRGEISEEQATLQIRIQINSIKTVIQSVKGLTLLTLESAINAAIDVVRGRINGTIGWPLF